MSYIRCLSNPEKLYIYGSSAGLEFCSSYPEETIICDEGDFQDFVIKWNEWQEDEFDYKNFSYKCENRGNENFKVYLRVDDKEFEMWYVTWMYIVHGIVQRKLHNVEYKLLYGSWFEKLLVKLLGV